LHLYLKWSTLANIQKWLFFEPLEIRANFLKTIISLALSNMVFFKEAKCDVMSFCISQYYVVFQEVFYFFIQKSKVPKWNKRAQIIEIIYVFLSQLMGTNTQINQAFCDEICCWNLDLNFFSKVHMVNVWSPVWRYWGKVETLRRGT
jgi:hypothetical protein